MLVNLRRAADNVDQQNLVREVVVADPDRIRRITVQLELASVVGVRVAGHLEPAHQRDVGRRGHPRRRGQNVCRGIYPDGHGLSLSDFYC